MEKNFYSSQEPPALSRGQTRTGPGGGWLPVFSRAPSLIEEGARRTRRGPGGGGPPPSVSLRTPNLIHKEEDEKGALSLMEEDRTRRGPGGRGGYDPPAPRMMRGPGGCGPPLSSRGQDKLVEECARRRRATSLIKEGPGGRGSRMGPGGGEPQTPREHPASPRRRKMKRGQVWHLIHCRLAQLLVGPWKKISN